MRNTVITAAAVFAIAATPAFAEDFSFKYQEHELSTRGGAKALMKRLENRVESYCTTSGRKSLTQRAYEEDCVEETLEDAVEKIGDPNVDEAFAQSNDQGYTG